MDRTQRDEIVEAIREQYRNSHTSLSYSEWLERKLADIKATVNYDPSATDPDA